MAVANRAPGPIYVRQYAKELRERGDLHFSVQYGHPVLVGFGVAGELASHNGGGEVRTIVTADSDMIERQAAIIISRVFPLKRRDGETKGPVFVGRTVETDVTIPEYSISKKHCLFQREGARAYTVMDAGSTNGTILNGERLARGVRAPVACGSVIGLGRFVFLFYDPEGFLTYLSALQ
jgi:hypothetical protein